MSYGINRRCLNRRLTFRTLAVVGLLCIHLLLFSGCRKNDICSERIPIEAGFVQLTFLTPDGQNLYPQDKPLPGFHIDSLYVSDASGRNFNQGKGEMPGPFATKYYVYSFGQIYNPATDADALVNEKCEDYYIYYNQADTDTLTLCYKITEDKCGLLYNPVKAYYRGQLIAQNQNTIFLPITIVK